MVRYAKSGIINGIDFIGKTLVEHTMQVHVIGGRVLAFDMFLKYACIKQGFRADEVTKETLVGYLGDVFNHKEISVMLNVEL